MAQLDHPNIVSLIGVITRGRPIYVVLGVNPYCSLSPSIVTLCIEHMRSGSLKSYLESNNAKQEQQFTWCREVASGLQHIHALGFIHRDVAVRQLMCDVT